MKFLQTMIVTITLIGGSHYAMIAQVSANADPQRLQAGIWYDTELQTDYRGNYNHVHLLYLSADYRISDHLQLSAASISIANGREESLLDDLQTFSNIEAEPQPFTLAVAGLTWSPRDRHSLFVGIRNVNEDYFDSPVTSLFINSSCGIFPTLSCNMDIANYPLASMALHYSYSAPSFRLQASAYNGQGYDRLWGASSLWRVTPRSDGLFLITQLDAQHDATHYYMGAAQHTGVQDGAGTQTALWTYAEHSLTDRLSLMADYSHAWGRSAQCTDFVGIGGQYARSRSTFGLFSDYARFRHDGEWATELTYRHKLTSWLYLQASCQAIHHGSWMQVGIIRMSVRIPED